MKSVEVWCRSCRCWYPIAAVHGLLLTKNQPNRRVRTAHADGGL